MHSLPVLQPNRPTPPPDCFGSQHWDPKHPECAGGLDMMYTSKTGSHVRERCHFFDSCGARVQAAKAMQQRMVPQPTKSFTFPAPAQAPQLKPLVSAAASREQVPQMSQPMMPHQPYAQPMTVPAQMMQGPWHPAPTYQFNHGIPHYLTVAEPRLPGESIWVILVREIVRGLFKSAGHTVSYFFDTNPMGRPPPQGG